MTASSNTKYQVVLIEPSEITVKGIRECCRNYSCFRFRACFSTWQAFITQGVRAEDCQVLIINPAIIQFHHSFNVKDLFVNYPNTCIVALQTQYISENILAHFDGVINIYDEGALVPKKLLHIVEIKKNDEQDQKESINSLLTNREVEVLIHVARGLSSKEIASTMCLSTHTVTTHRKALIRKTGIKTVSGLVLYALANHLVTQETLQAAFHSTPLLIEGINP